MIHEIRRCAGEVHRAATETADHLSITDVLNNIENIIRSHESNSSQTHRLIMVGGVGYPVPNKVADEFRAIRAQVKQLQDHCAELTRDLNMQKARP